MSTNKGNIILLRATRDFNAGFGLIRSRTPDLEEFLAALHPVERNVFDCLPTAVRKDSYLLGRVAAKMAISMIVESEAMPSVYIDQGIFMFPVVKSHLNHSIQVSISHCNDIAIGLAFPEEHPLSVDIERIRPDIIEITREYFSTADQKLLENCRLSDPAGHTLLWTVKESLTKILRTGLTMDLTSVEIQSIEKKGDNCFISIYRNHLQYQAISFLKADYICSITLPRNTNAVWVDFKAAINSLW